MPTIQRPISIVLGAWTMSICVVLAPIPADLSPAPRVTCAANNCCVVPTSCSHGQRHRIAIRNGYLLFRVFWPRIRRSRSERLNLTSFSNRHCALSIPGELFSDIAKQNALPCATLSFPLDILSDRRGRIHGIDIRARNTCQGSTLSQEFPYPEREIV